MLYNTFIFPFVFAVIVLFYYLIPMKVKMAYLLLVSLGFYALWNPAHLPLLVLMILYAYAAGRFVEAKAPGKCVFAVLIAILFLPLVLCKYGGPALSMPVGLSFYSFIAAGYLFDVRRCSVRAEKSFLRFALFLSFFPQQCAGPIERAGHMLPQLSEKKHTLSFENVEIGSLYMLWGYVLKSIIADQIKPMTDGVFSADYHTLSGVTLLLTVFLYSIQIYCDFAGYSYLVMGAAKILDIDVIRNFRAPYYAVSTSDFWRRWHISLTSWLTDYIYIPLGGNRKGKIRQYLNIAIVFFVSGIWHGNGLSFIVWGLINAFYQIMGKLLKPFRDRMVSVLHIRRDSGIHKIFRTAVTFVLIAFSWIFFRAPSLKMALTYIKCIVRQPFVMRYDGGDLPMLIPSASIETILLLVFFIFLAALVDRHLYRGEDETQKFLKKKEWIKVLVFFFLFMSVVIFGVYGPKFNEADYIYKQF